MANFISTGANRFYAALEPSFGYPASPSAANRFAATRLGADQTVAKTRRLDKTGTRTFQGQSPLSRRQTTFEIQTYLSRWNGSGEPGYGCLFEAAFGAKPDVQYGQLVQAATALQINTALPHGLSVGCGVSLRSEIRFVAAVLDGSTFLVNAPFSVVPLTGDIFVPAITYRLATELPSVTIFDYWDPVTTASRAIRGAALNQMTLDVNGDFHRFTFSGPAADILDSASYQPGQTVWASFPAEPTLGPFDAAGVPGHLGQAWIGTSQTEFLTLTEATIRLNNGVVMRNSDFGTSYPQSFAPGQREITSNVSVLANDTNQSLDLYRAAKARTPVPLMLQLGVQQGQLAGVYLPNQVLELPTFDDHESRLHWTFHNNFAQGGANDEMFLAFA